jgi:diguanylate cyclase (GGDEF)-like protein/PAS domain S-box-containing protein
MPAPDSLAPTARSGRMTIDEPALARRIRAAQVRATTRFTPMAFVVNLLNATLVGAVLWPVADPMVLGLWIGTMTLLMSLALRSWFLARRRPRREVSHRAIRSATIQAAVLGALWGLVPAVWFPVASASAQLLIASVVTGMMCGGGFALATVLPAAIAYVLLLTGGGLVGLALSDTTFAPELSVLLLIYAATLLYSAGNMAALFRQQLASEAELRERGQVIELLLAEFEENASDWLFEIDVEGRIVQHSPRFADVMAEEDWAIAGRLFAELLSPGGAAEFRRALAARQPFRGLVVEARTRAGRRWWSLTAGPLRDDGGAEVGWRGVGSDVTERKLAQDRIARMAEIDELTGLKNRAAFRSELAEALAGAAAGDGVALALIDLDGFKQVNDAYGHVVGDQLLRSVARRLSRFSSDIACAGRLGGDEFGVLLARGDGQARIALCAALVSALSEIHEIGGDRIKISASIGLAEAGSDGRDVDTLTRNADLALYEAKIEGGAQVGVFSSWMQEQAEERRRLQADLEEACGRDELRLLYQPIVDIASGRTVGFEALLRWQHPQRGLVSPLAFIPLAERSGLILPIGEWVLARACRDAAQWPEQLFVSVNVSAVQIARTDMAATIRTALAEAGLPAPRLEIEITESVYLNAGNHTARFLRDTRGLGVRIALDDFGTGYSSLSYLSRLKVDKIKIDKAFVDGRDASLPRREILTAIVGLAGGLGLTTTAEGVEDAATLALLGEVGVGLSQGYLHGRPMELADVAAHLAAEAARQIGRPEPALRSRA